MNQHDPKDKSQEIMRPKKMDASREKNISGHELIGKCAIIWNTTQKNNT